MYRRILEEKHTNPNSYQLEGTRETDEKQSAFSSKRDKGTWLATLAAVPLGLGSNSGEGMGVCKCIMPLWHGSTLNSSRATNPLLRKGKRSGRVLTPPGYSPSKLGWNLAKIVLSPLVLKSTANDRRESSPFP
ncbi:hypothetical protein TNCV_836721 [Trichonephila clavipes]|nr:hypothetical protein TNCV_836721 [Trichonephila clavipes]